MYPGNKFLKLAPTKLDAFNEAKGTSALYDEFKAAVAAEGGGGNMTGWRSKTIHAVTQRFQPRFNERGVGVHFSMVKWWIQHGQSGHMEYRYWFEFSDVAVVGQHVPEHAFDPDAKGSKEDARDAPVVSAEVVAGTADDGFDIAGAWEMDLERASGSIKSWVTAASCTVTRNGPVWYFTGTTQLSYFLCFGRTYSWAAPAQNEEPNKFMLRVEGRTSTIVATSADEMTCMAEDGGMAPMRRVAAAAAGGAVAAGKAA